MTQTKSPPENPARFTGQLPWQHGRPIHQQILSTWRRGAPRSGGGEMRSPHAWAASPAAHAGGPWRPGAMRGGQDRGPSPGSPSEKPLRFVLRKTQGIPGSRGRIPVFAISLSLRTAVPGISLFALSRAREALHTYCGELCGRIQKGPHGKIRRPRSSAERCFCRTPEARFTPALGQQVLGRRRAAVETVRSQVATSGRGRVCRYTKRHLFLLCHRNMQAVENAGVFPTACVVIKVQLFQQLSSFYDTVVLSVPVSMGRSLQEPAQMSHVCSKSQQ